jgi:ABC-type lipoprotein export system ATPase subunit
VDTDVAAGVDTDVAGGVDVHVRGLIHLYPQQGADVVALRGVDLDIEAGEMLALLGPSGMGKSTLLQLLAGVMRPSAGEIHIGEQELGALNAAGLRRLRAGDVSFVLQDTARNLLPYATVAQNVWFAQQGDRHRTMGYDTVELLRLLGLSDISQQPVGTLPRGAQQMVALAAGVAAVPRLLLADEPTNQLDSAATIQVIELLRTINEQLGTTIILVTHDPVVAAALPRTVTIRDGRVGAEGRQGVQYAVMDASGTIQMPPEVREHIAPMTRFVVEHDEDGIHLRPDHPDGNPR